jgi:hypothetical protein
MPTETECRARIRACALRRPVILSTRSVRWNTIITEAYAELSVDWDRVVGLALGLDWGGCLAALDTYERQEKYYQSLL